MKVKITRVQDMPIISYINRFQSLEGNFLFRQGRRIFQQIPPRRWYLLIKILVSPPRNIFRVKDTILRVYTSTCNVEVRGIVLSLKHQIRPVIASNMLTVSSDFSVVAPAWCSVLYFYKFNTVGTNYYRAWRVSLFSSNVSYS